MVTLVAVIMGLLPGPAEAVLPGDDFTLTVTKTNNSDANTVEDDDVTFTVTVANPNAFPVTITDVTDSYDSTTIDVCDGVGPGDVDLVGLTLAASNVGTTDEATCIFTLTGYAPAEGVTITNTVEIAAEAAGGTRAPNTRFLIVDAESIDNDRPYLTDDDHNGTFTNLHTFPAAGMGENDPQPYQRTPLSFMQSNIGLQLIVATGQSSSTTSGDTAYFEIDEDQLPTSGSLSWTDPTFPSTDPIRNFFGEPLVEPGHAVPRGLGGVPGNVSESRLDKIKGVTFRTPAIPPPLTDLVGSQLCLLVKDSDVGMDLSKNEMNLQGSYLGVFGAEVLGVVSPIPTSLNSSSDALPGLKLEILDAVEVCGTPDDLLGGGTATSDVFTPAAPDEGTIELVKDFQGAAGTVDLNINGGTAEATGVGDGGSTGPITVAAGSGHSVSEAAAGTTNLSDYVSSVACFKNGSATPFLAGTGTSLSGIAVADGDVVVCTITNRRKGTLELVKDFEGTAGTVDLNIDGGTAEATGVGDGGTTGPVTVEAGNHSVSEAAAGTTDLSDYVSSVACFKNGSATPFLVGTGTSLSGIAVANTDVVVCTITNRRKGTLELVKDFVGTTGTVDLNIDGGTAEATGVGDGGTTGSVTVEAGNHSVSEAAAGSTDLTDYVSSVACRKNGATDPFISGAGTSLSGIAVANTDVVVCTITNTRVGTLELVKDFVGTAGTVDLNIDGGTAEATSVGDGGTTGAINVAAGNHSVSEAAAGTTNLSDYVSTIACRKNGATDPFITGNGTSLSGIAVANGDTVVCTITNTRKGTLELVKDFVGTAGTVDLNIDGGTAEATSVGDGGTTGPVTVNAGNHSVSEAAAGTTDLSDYVSSVACRKNGATDPFFTGNGTSLSGIAVANGDTVVCTITNTRKGTAGVEKTVSGAAPTGTQAFVFQLRQGASTTSLGTILESVTANAGNGGIVAFTTKLIPGQTYQLCEADMLPGWDTSLDNGGFGTAFVPDDGNPGTDIDNSVVCVDFTVTPGQNKVFEINNVPPPGGDARTIGFWKSWTSCDGSGNQAHVLDQTLASFPIADGQTTRGVFIGDIYVDTCQEAVKILNKSKLNGTKMANDAAYELAAQLLAAKLNLQASAGSCSAADTAILNGQKLLSGQAPYNTTPAIHFNATGSYLGPKLKGAALTRRNQALALASTLDSYNNNLLCP